jgi:hypothetical protein
LEIDIFSGESSLSVTRGFRDIQPLNLGSNYPTLIEVFPQFNGKRSAIITVHYVQSLIMEKNDCASMCHCKCHFDQRIPRRYKKPYGCFCQNILQPFGGMCLKVVSIFRLSPK